MTPNEQQRYRATTEKVAAMYGHRFRCRQCFKDCAPAGRKKAKGEGWICAGCAGREVRDGNGAQKELASS